jgi:phi13 family phage major tail protein
MANKILYGLNNVHYAVIVGMDEATGEEVYDTPKPIPYGVNLSLSKAGETFEVYADNMKIVSEATNNGYEGTLEVTIVPDSFNIDVLGKLELSEKGFMYEDSNTNTVQFALMFEFSGDQHSTRHIFWRCSCSRNDITSKTTTNTKEPVNATLDLTIMPSINYHVHGKMVKNTANMTMYDNFFKEVLTVEGLMSSNDTRAFTEEQRETQEEQ